MALRQAQDERSQGVYDERAAVSNLIPNINNGLSHDEDYEKGEPARNVEVLQTWEAIAQLNNQLVAPDVHESLNLLENAIARADIAYTRLSGLGFSIDVETNRDEYISALREGIKTFKQRAEI